MFVLRSYEPDAESVSRPEIGPEPVTSGKGESTGAEPVDLEAARQGRAPRETPAPAPCTTPAPAAGGRPQARGSMQMPLFAAAFAVRFGGATAAAECPKHFADVQSLIDRVSAGVERARDRLPWDRAELVHALLDDARMLLDAARRNHEQPCGAYDHARAYAKADAALGHARAAQIVFSRSTQE
jgi:hypothetical protein